MLSDSIAQYLVFKNWNKILVLQGPYEKDLEISNSFSKIQIEISFHTDMVQTSGKVKLDLNKSEIDFASVTSHKIGGPRGIGLLYARQGTTFESLVTGGKQERIRRAGTENVTLAVGFAKALEW